MPDVALELSPLVWIAFVARVRAQVLRGEAIGQGIPTPSVTDGHHPSLYGYNE
jgi:hypothetical protein